MGGTPVSINQFSYLQTKWQTPKAGVTGSNPVGRASKQKLGPLRAQFCLPVCPVQGVGGCSIKGAGVLGANHFQMVTRHSSSGELPRCPSGAQTRYHHCRPIFLKFAAWLSSENGQYVPMATSALPRKPAASGRLLPFRCADRRCFEWLLSATAVAHGYLGKALVTSREPRAATGETTGVQ